MNTEAEEEPEPKFRYRFGTAEFNAATFELKVGGIDTGAEWRVLEVLELLLQHEGHLVTKDFILKQLFNRSNSEAISDSALPNAVGKLRKALGGKDSDNGRYIVTRRHGYLFDGNATAEEITQAKPDISKLEVGLPIPKRNDFALISKLKQCEDRETWLAEHTQTGDKRVFKFFWNARHVGVLKQTANIYQKLRENLGARNDIAWLEGWNFDTAPFFLEFQHAGESLTNWTGTDTSLQDIPLQERLNLFIEIVDAVGATHGVGGPHRDLKPNNIGVTPKPESGWQIHVTDFNGQALDDSDGETQGEDSHSSPYLAPELAAGEAATIESDVYALGLLLYQIVVGDFRMQLTSDWQTKLPDELLAADIATARNGNPTARFHSAAEFAGHLRNLKRRRDEEAERKTAELKTREQKEETRRLKARQPWMIAVIATLILGVTIAGFLYARALRSERRYMTELATTQTLKSFLTDDFIAAADPDLTGRTNVTVLEAAKTAAKRIDQTFAGAEPQLRGDLHLELGKTFIDLTDSQSALSECEKALSIYLSAQDTDSERIADAQLTTVDILARIPRLQEAKSHLAAAEERMKSLRPADALLEIRLLYEKANIAFYAYDPQEALNNSQKAWVLAQQVQSIPSLLAERLEFSLADAYRMTGRWKEAEAVFKDLINREIIHYGKADARPAISMIGLASALSLEEHDDEALSVLSSALPILEHALGPENDNVLNAKTTLAGIYFSTQEYDDAIARWQEIAGVIATKKGMASKDYLAVENNIGMSLLHEGKSSEAEKIFLDDLAIARPAFDKTDPVIGFISYYLAAARLDQNKTDGVAELLEGLVPEKLQIAQQEPDWDGRLEFQAGRLACLKEDHAHALELLRDAKRIIDEKDPGGVISDDTLDRLIQQCQ
jgi:eukaryotic-like serine/threonine-protein kinase